MSAEGLTPVDTTVTTNSKRGSERTLQSSKNQFLVNARNDSFDSLSVRTKIPAGADVLLTFMMFQTIGRFNLSTILGSWLLF